MTHHLLIRCAIVVLALSLLPSLASAQRAQRRASVSESSQSLSKRSRQLRRSRPARASTTLVQPSGLADRVPRLPSGAPIVVTPLLFVPSDGHYDRWADADAAMRTHAAIAQQHYQSLLGTTFAVARGPLPVLHGAHASRVYEENIAERANTITRELFAWAHTDRYASNHLFVVLYVSQTPISGGGIPFNGSIGTGGGYVEIDASSLLTDAPYPFQSTLVHEIGHALGLNHVDCRGEDMQSHASMMSYDPDHHSSGTSQSSDPGNFDPIELASLTLTPRALPDMRIRPAALSEHDLTRAEQCLLPPMGPAIGPYRSMPGVGLELFYDRRRVNGADASLYTRARAIEACRWSRDRYPNIAVTCRYNGSPLTF